MKVMKLSLNFTRIIMSLTLLINQQRSGFGTRKEKLDFGRYCPNDETDFTARQPSFQGYDTVFGCFSFFSLNIQFFLSSFNFRQHLHQKCIHLVSHFDFWFKTRYVQRRLFTNCTVFRKARLASSWAAYKLSRLGQFTDDDCIKYTEFTWTTNRKLVFAKVFFPNSFAFLSEASSSEESSLANWR